MTSQWTQNFQIIDSFSLNLNLLSLSPWNIMFYSSKMSNFKRMATNDFSLENSNIFDLILYRVADPSCHPQFSPFARIQKKTESWTGHPLKWLSPWLATPQKMAESQTLLSLGVASSGLCNFLGWQVISESGQIRTRFFSGFWHIGKIGGGKKDQPPCIYRLQNIPNGQNSTIIVGQMEHPNAGGCLSRESVSNGGLG